MKLPYLSKEALERFIQSALQEDVGENDHSTVASVPAGAENKAELIIKGDGILAGVEMARLIFQQVNPALHVTINKQDGQAIKKGDIAFTVEGPARAILTAERLVLNCMQRMSAIATYTHRLQSKIQHTKCKLLDTRKTTPNFRIAEKWAVAIGGGTNHRFGLYDMIMLKDNHIDFCGSITKAVEQTKYYLTANKLDLKIEVETRNLAEVKECLQVGGIAVIMLDNMSNNEMKQAVELIGTKAKTEASGGITEETIVEKAECGVDYVSIGALTHSYHSLDMSLKAIK